MNTVSATATDVINSWGEVVAQMSLMMAGMAVADISRHVASAPESRKGRRLVTLRRHQREANSPTQVAGKSPGR
jgi:hypothetical protein